MTRYYKATFSDGMIAKRSTMSREYSHAWRVGRQTGFASSAELAGKALTSNYTAWVDVPREIVTVEELTVRDYDRLCREISVAKRAEREERGQC